MTDIRGIEPHHRRGLRGESTQIAMNPYIGKHDATSMADLVFGVGRSAAAANRGSLSSTRIASGETWSAISSWKEDDMSPKAAKRETLTKLAAVLLAVSMMGVGASGCALLGSGSSVSLESGPQNPASQGNVKTRVTKDNNTQVSVTVKHLAPPAKLAQGATTYVVWARPIGVPLARNAERQPVSGETETGVYNLGGLKIGKNLDGHLETVTPFRSFEIFITPEPSTSVTVPNGERALWTTISKD